MRALIITILMLAGCVAQSDAQSKLKIELTGLSEKGGVVYLALFNSSESFMKDRMIGTTLKVEGTTLTTELELADGEYAITLFQDEDSNKQLNLGEFGIPIEKYGFSNNAKPVMGPPSFEACKFLVKGDTEVKIDMQ